MLSGRLKAICGWILSWTIFLDEHKHSAAKATANAVDYVKVNI